MKQATPWRCPVCKGLLAENDRTLRCADGHSFDLAREGYCNLLLANRKRSKNPGDDKAMLRARSLFLGGGHYAPLMTQIVAALAPHISSDSTLLDCGCGDGTYAAFVYAALRPSIYGIDIAREAVRLASRRFKAVGDATDTTDGANDNNVPCPVAFAVASSFDLPLPDDSCDAALQVFAPVSEAELLRVLKPNGVYCAVFPASQHLMALKEAMYTTVRTHKGRGHPEGFLLLHEERVTFDMALKSSADIQNLLAMTPLNWRGSREGKAALRAMTTLDVGADFVVRLYRPV